MERHRIISLAIISIAAVTSLTILAIAYWAITGQDGTVLTTVAAIIGGALGYAVRYLAEHEEKKG